MYELQNQTPVVINLPEYSAHIQARHNARATMVCTQQTNMLAAHRAKKVAIEQSIVTNPGNLNMLTELAKVDNDIIQLQFDISQDVDIYLSKKEKSGY